MGQVMMDYCELMDVYKAFVSGSAVRSETIARLQSENPRFQKFMVEASQGAGGHSLESLTINPVQRVPRYVLLVRYTAVCASPSYAAAADESKPADVLLDCACACG